MQSFINLQTCVYTLYTALNECTKCKTIGPCVAWYIPRQIAHPDPEVQLHSYNLILKSIPVGYSSAGIGFQAL